LEKYCNSLAQLSSIWVEDRGSFCTICKTLHSTCQAFERQTSSFVSKNPRFAFVLTVNRVEQAEWRGCPHFPSTLQTLNPASFNRSILIHL
jgi:hypothetical protein